jgi:hypothetical protein
MLVTLNDSFTVVVIFVKGLPPTSVRLNNEVAPKAHPKYTPKPSHIESRKRF